MSDSAPVASVIVRTLNKATTLGPVLEALRSQTEPVEIIVVDSGSTDGTLAIAERYADKIEHLEPGQFSFGRALNVGARAATTDFHFALSAHTMPPDAGWVERSLAHYKRPDVAATNGSNDAVNGPNGEPFGGTIHQTAEDADANPMWGYSNTATSWRASVWQTFPFDEAIESAEDKEWSWRVLAAGWVIAYDRSLSASSTHRRSEGKRALFQRVKKEARALARLREDLRPSLPQTVVTWWSYFPYPSNKPRLLRLLSPNRNIELLARYLGAREAR